MRIAELHMDLSDKTKFDVIGKSSVRYHVKANHTAEAKRWFWSLNNAIQYSKDEAKEGERKRTQIAESPRPAKAAGGNLGHSATKSAALAAPSSLSVARARSSIDVARSSVVGSTSADDAGPVCGPYEPSLVSDYGEQPPKSVGEMAVVDSDDEHDQRGSDLVYSDLADNDIYNTTVQSAKFQLELLAHMSESLDAEKEHHPEMSIADPNIAPVLDTYRRAVSSLDSLVVSLLGIWQGREAHWQYLLDKERDTRKMWEDSMARTATEQDSLETQVGKSEERRRRTKRALRDALEGQQSASASELHEGVRIAEEDPGSMSSSQADPMMRSIGLSGSRDGIRRRKTMAELTDISDSESGDDEEFFDAVDAGQVEVLSTPLSPPTVPKTAAGRSTLNQWQSRRKEIEPAFQGYESPVRERLKIDADNRPQVSLWGIMKSMIGQDLSKMTLPVSFNEPTSLLQRLAEDMEYSNLLDMAVEQPRSAERMVYVAGFAASAFSSSVGRVAKPFNPLLGETFEYARPDKGYRYLIEQVSHHPPISAMYAESARWEYFGESAVQSRFSGKTFDLHHLGTWFVRLWPANGGPAELYSWKKVMTSVVGIITGNPMVDNYGPMEIKNWTTGEKCLLDFKPRGWKASSAYHVTGKVVDGEGATKWSIGGRWSDKIYARDTPGFEDRNIKAPASNALPALSSSSSNNNSSSNSNNNDQAILIWQCHPRPDPPTLIPFSLTPFAVTLNALPPNLQRYLAPTDSRFRPDQRAMEEGRYDLAASEKVRVEEKQRAARRAREARNNDSGDSRGDGHVVWKPKWFIKRTEPITGVAYWDMRRENEADDLAPGPEVEEQEKDKADKNDESAAESGSVVVVVEDVDGNRSKPESSSSASAAPSSTSVSATSSSSSLSNGPRSLYWSQREKNAASIDHFSGGGGGASGWDQYCDDIY